MPLVIPVGFAHVIHTFTGTPAPTGAAITYGIDHDGSVTPSAVAADLHDALGDEIMPSLDLNLQLEETRVKFGPNDTGPFGIAGGARAGGVVGANAVPNTAILVRKNTNLGGKRGQGRVYVPGVGEADVNDIGTLTSGAQTTFQTAWNAFQVRINALPYAVQMQLLHGSGQSSLPNPTAVTSMTVQSVVATQRRRLRR